MATMRNGEGRFCYVCSCHATATAFMRVYARSKDIHMKLEAFSTGMHVCEVAHARYRSVCTEMPNSILHPSHWRYQNLFLLIEWCAIAVSREHSSECKKIIKMQISLRSCEDWRSIRTISVYYRINASTIIETPVLSELRLFHAHFAMGKINISKFARRH